MRRDIKATLALAVGSLIAIAVGVPASAHTQLIGVDPTEGATVVVGDTVTLSFSENLLTIGAGATVTDSAGKVTTLDVTFPTPDSAQVVMPAVPRGALTLAWRVVAGDGHPVEGTVVYVADGAPTSASPTTATLAAEATATATQPGPSAIPNSAQPAPRGGDSGVNMTALLLLIGAVAIAAIIALITVTRRHK